ncbi:MAG: DUF5320 domain-containing protein [Firmicutes bacterium]|jgi:hypothetical protein|nr:DUF5320 domain-containing protein [Bacillota bacterium]
MPGRDQRGPEGMGPMTGKGMGYCKAEETSGRGIRCFGFRRNGSRRGNRANGFRGVWNLEDEEKYLMDQKANIERRLEELRK